MKATEVYEKVTASIIEQLERGARGEDWRAPWHGLSSMPRNASTGKAYRGGNVVALWVAEMVNEYELSYWATYKQWQELGAQVRRGEKSTALVKWVESDRAKKGAPAPKAGERKRSYLFPVGFASFNAAQVDMVERDDEGKVVKVLGPWAPPAAPVTNVDPIDAAEELFAAVGADVRHHARPEAFYHREGDYIVVPPLTAHTSSERYYSVLAHEHVHWTGAPARLDREKGKSFGDTVYAREELIAELGAAFVCAQLGIDDEPRADHAQYLASWLAALRTDPSAIFSAATQAQKAVDFLTAFVPAPELVDA